VRTFTTKWFRRWAGKHGVTDNTLLVAVDEMRRGLIDADLGGHVVKKRVPLPGRGKRSGARTIVAFRDSHHVFFIYGFAKNERDNIDPDELDAFRLLAKELQSYDAERLTRAIRAGELYEVISNA
jgi:hypothetical protein